MTVFHTLGKEKESVPLPEEPFDLGNVRLQISGSLGVAFYERGMDEKTLVGHADEAMYRAKKNGKKTTTNSK